MEQLLGNISLRRAILVCDTELVVFEELYLLQLAAAATGSSRQSISNIIEKSTSTVYRLVVIQPLERSIAERIAGIAHNEGAELLTFGDKRFRAAIN